MLMAMMRAQREGFLSIHVVPTEDYENAIAIVESNFVRGTGPSSLQVRLAARDSDKRLLEPSMETEAISFAQKEAEGKAVKIFAENLSQLLLEAPHGTEEHPGHRSRIQDWLQSRDPEWTGPASA